MFSQRNRLIKAFSRSPQYPKRRLGYPQLSEVTQRVLEQFGVDERVRQEFASPGGVRSYSGDIVGQHLEEAKFAAKFLDYPLEPVRFWARIEQESAFSEADRWRQHIEERRW